MKIGLLDTRIKAKIEKNFIDDEVELGLIRKHYIYLIKGLAFELFYTIVLILAFFIIYFVIDLFTLPIWINYILWSITLLLILYRLALLLIDYRFDFIIGTNFRLFSINNDFIFKFDYHPVSYDQIEEINFSRHGIWQSLFDYGTVTILVKGKDRTNDIIFKYASSAQNLINQISNAHAQI
ncbi:MAG TPA: hypothetical protein PLQ36_03765, partial [Candidatus Gracilibacteria bacterium]|nr:hypothetical protein [Candidatus Gracilibacteria bacterium]